MGSKKRNVHSDSRTTDIHCFNIPIECIRKTRALNVDRDSSCVSWEVYKIFKSNNGRKILSPHHIDLRS